jgi:hypothetical protein
MSRQHNVGHFATIKTEERTVEKEVQGIKYKIKEQSEKKKKSLSGISTATFSTWLDLPGVITPADIAHGFIETRKPPHHGKVQSSTRLSD